MFTNLNNIGNYFTSGSNTGLTGVDKIIYEHAKEKAQPNDEQAPNDNTLYISNRSQKLNALSTQFFKGGDISYVDVDALKVRAYELGLISKSEYENLTNSESSSPSKNEDVSTTSVVNFIDNFLVQLKELESEQESSEEKTEDEKANKSETLERLKEALADAKVIIKDIDKPKNDDTFKESINTTLLTLKEVITADSFDKMPPDGKVGISKVYQALKIIDNISPHRISNDKVNKYLELSLR